jgi:hypothetical protein
MDVDNSGACDFAEFSEAIMLSREHAAGNLNRDKHKVLEPRGGSDSKIAGRPALGAGELESEGNSTIDVQRELTRKRVERELQMRIEVVKAENADDFMASMRRRLGEDRLSSDAAFRDDGSGSSSSAEDNINNNNNGSLGVFGTRASSSPVVSSSSSLTHLPAIISSSKNNSKNVVGASPAAVRNAMLLAQQQSQVPTKAAASSARRAQKIIRDRDPRAAFVVAQSSLSPQYTRLSATVSSTVRPQQRV